MLSSLTSNVAPFLLGAIYDRQTSSVRRSLECVLTDETGDVKKEYGAHGSFRAMNVNHALTANKHVEILLI